MRLKLVSAGEIPSMPDSAAGWAARLDRGDLSDAEYDAWESWLGEPGNPDAYAEAAAALDVFGGMDAAMPELAALREEALRDPPPAVADAEVSSRRRNWTPWAGGALAASIAAAFLWLGQPAGDQQGKGPQVADNRAGVSVPVADADAAYRTAVGEQRTVQLADGSTVTLNTASEMVVDYRAGERIVRLVRGQALFDVAHAPDRPFSVIVAGRKVTALGTVFEVRLDEDDRLKVMLVRGKVRVDEDKPVAAGAKPPALAILAPGQQFVAAGALAPAVESVDVDKQLLWRRSLVEFDDEPIDRAIAELNRYSSTKIVVADSRVAAMRMSGIVRTGDASEFTTLVGAMLPVGARKNAAGEIEIYALP